VFREYLLEHLPVSELVPHFRDGVGRPSKDLHVALGALVLQQLHDLTDQQTSEAVALNIAWHYALDIRHEPDAYVCERTLRNYRSTVLELGLDEVLFRTLTDQLISTIGVDTTKQRLDSTAVRSAIRNLTRLGILVEAMSKFLRELKRELPEQYATVDKEVSRKYVERQGDGCFADTRPSESKRRLPEAAQDVYAVVQQFQQTAAELESFQLLARIFEEQCEVVDDPDQPVTIRPPRTKDCDTILSPADPDASYNKHKGTGYTVQIMETYAEDDEPADGKQEPAKPDLITHVAVGKMTTHDQDAIEPALDDVGKRGVKPEELLADSHYGSNDSLEKGLRCGVKIIAPSMPAKGKKQGKLTLEDFELDADGRVLRCPEGHTPIETSAADVRLQVLFAASDCAACSQRHCCLLSAVGRKINRYQYTHDRLRQRQRRLDDATDEFRDRYRWRAGVEATMSRFKYQMGMAKLQIRGMKKVTYIAVLRALGLNIHRVAAYRASLR
jgi:Sec-independent protein translocase protein TatA